MLQELQARISSHHAQLQVPITTVGINTHLCACKQGINDNDQ